MVAFPQPFRPNDLRTGFASPIVGIPGAMSTTIVPYENGPLIVRGDFELRTPDGKPLDPGRATIALCRCGKSAIKPFCDGMHKAIRFRAGVDRDAPSPR